MKGATFHRCGCSNPETGKRYAPGKCPRLTSNKRADRDHGNWWGRYDAPMGADQKRRQPWIGPFETQTAAENALAAELARLGAGSPVLDKKILVKDYLATWLEGKRSLKSDTFKSYEEAIRLYFNPALGHLKLCDLRDHHVSDMITAMMQINRPLPDGEKPSELLQRLIEVRADDERRELKPGEARHKKSTRPLKPSRVKRIIAVLNSALNAAAKSKKIDFNPAKFVELPRQRRKGRVKPLVWTKPRVDAWVSKGRAPGPVMVWTPKQIGTFLDFIAEERLSALYHLTAFRGLRRAELAGLPDSEVDLDEAFLWVREILPDEDEDDFDVYDDYDDPEDPKSEAGERIVPLDSGTVNVLKTWKRQQAKERLMAGPAWIDSGMFFTRVDGRPLREEWISERFDALIDKYNTIQRGHEEGLDIAWLALRHRVSESIVMIAVNGDPLPPVRFHDLRHLSATLSLAAGVAMKVVSETLGHSKSSFTSDTYTSVLPEVATAAAEAVAAIVPRSTRRTAG
jgi:integrase